MRATASPSETLSPTCPGSVDQGTLCGGGHGGDAAPGDDHAVALETDGNTSEDGPDHHQQHQAADVAARDAARRDHGDRFVEPLDRINGLDRPSRGRASRCSRGSANSWLRHGARRRRYATRGAVLQSYGDALRNDDVAGVESAGR